jgi:metal-responsive CopG/Arc/MetJ family transcriptional regulator
MKTIRITIDEPLLHQIDHVTDDRSAFISKALRHYFKLLRLRQQELQHRQGYERHPAARGEFDVWEKEQVWGDE